MSALAAFGGVLAWPDGSGLAGATLLGTPAYVHTHLKLNRHHRERLADSGAEPQVSGGITPFDSRERLDGPPAPGRT